MLDTTSPLVTEFLKDHQQFSRLLYEISKLLEAEDLQKARVRAEELNRLAGPHIAYEEAELYPRLQGMGVTSVSEEHLVGEHHQVLDAVELLLRSEPLTPDELTQCREGIKIALDHAEHCGSLISLVSRLGQKEQAASLVVLKQLREEGKSWTELKR